MTILYPESFRPGNRPFLPDFPGWQPVASGEMYIFRIPELECWVGYRSRIGSFIHDLARYYDDVAQLTEPAPKRDQTWVRHVLGRTTGKSMPYSEIAAAGLVLWGSMYQHRYRWNWKTHISRETGLVIHNPIVLEDQPKQWTSYEYHGGSQYADVIRQDVFPDVRPIPPKLYER